jgi:Flp pilus assembly secretin CpaC
MLKMVVGLIAVLLSTAMVRAADFEVDCWIHGGDPKGTKAAGTLKTVAAPTLVLRSKETASCLVGGQIPIGATMVPIGQEVEVTATAIDNGAIKVHAVFKVHTQVGGATAPQVSTVSEEATAVIQSGGSVRVEIGKDPRNQKWVDLTVRSIP